VLFGVVAAAVISHHYRRSPKGGYFEFEFVQLLTAFRQSLRVLYRTV